MIFNKNLNSSYILNFLFFLFPITYIIGNFAINLFTIFTILTCACLYKKELFYLSFLKGEKIFILLAAFFFILITSTFLNYENLDHFNVTKFSNSTPIKLFKCFLISITIITSICGFQTFPFYNNRTCFLALFFNG